MTVPAVFRQAGRRKTGHLVQEEGRGLGNKTGAIHCSCEVVEQSCGQSICSIDAGGDIIVGVHVGSVIVEIPTDLIVISRERFFVLVVVWS